MSATINLLSEEICCVALIFYLCRYFIAFPFPICKAKKGSARDAYAVYCTSDTIVERDKGFEPSRPAWKAGMLAIKHQSRTRRLSLFLIVRKAANNHFALYHLYHFLYSSSLLGKGSYLYLQRCQLLTAHFQCCSKVSPTVS